MRIVPTLVLLSLLAACGQTGDLYLPNQTPPPSASPPEDKDKKKEQPAAPASESPAQPN